MWDLFDDTVEFWKSWLAQSTYTGRWREMVNRSAITLKLMTYAPTGGLVAAPTAGAARAGRRRAQLGLPLHLGPRRLVLGLRAAAAGLHRGGRGASATWLRDRVAEQRRQRRRGAAQHHVPRRRLLATSSEEVLEHWEGYRGSCPVRIGNGAADQLQLDIYGEAIDSVYLGDQRGLPAGPPGLAGDPRACSTGSCDNWDQPEEGIWETRGGRQDFTYGRLMCWVALRPRHPPGRPSTAGRRRWTAGRPQRDAIYDQIMERGWNAERQAFVQHYDDRVLDSSLLRMSRVGFISPHDPMWLSTLDAMDDELVTDSLVYRYDPSASPDGLRGSEGTFSLCTFAYVDALARAGRLDEARLAFEKMLTYANHLGLYSEEIAPDR